MVAPALFTFDIFGTVVDWRRGLTDALARCGVGLSEAGFDRVIDAQAGEESGPFRPYASIVAASLTSQLGLDPDAAMRIAAEVGTWPLYPDSASGLLRLQRLAPCVAITNSDRAHGAQVQAQLGFPLSGWVCAEDSRVYKPSPRFWQYVAERRGIEFGPHWWHVSAYADYDLVPARSLGLTCVFVARPHARPGPADVTVFDLRQLARWMATREESPE
ncbi:MAG TPA: HAD family hydrolase [Candidatus Eisenbacteria bacterium]|jgi:2-haloacid dehalogenase